MNLSVIKTLDTSVKLRWLEPRAPNGILQGYQVVVQDLSNNLNESRKLTDTQPLVEYTLTELAPFTWFRVYAQAYSRKFLGELSQPVKFRTDVSAPSLPHSVNVSCFSLDSILIQWQRPERFYNQIDFYYVHYKPDFKSSFERTVLATKKEKLLNELLITNLTAGILYELKVLAGTKSILDPTLVYTSDSTPTLRVVLEKNCESKYPHPLVPLVSSPLFVFISRRTSATYWARAEPARASALFARRGMAPPPRDRSREPGQLSVSPKRDARRTKEGEQKF